jgi:hypothetical protein
VATLGSVYRLGHQPRRPLCSFFMTFDRPVNSLHAKNWIFTTTTALAYQQSEKVVITTHINTIQKSWYHHDHYTCMPTRFERVGTPLSQRPATLALLPSETHGMDDCLRMDDRDGKIFFFFLGGASLGDDVLCICPTTLVPIPFLTICPFLTLGTLVIECLGNPLIGRLGQNHIPWPSGYPPDSLSGTNPSWTIWDNTTTDWSFGTNPQPLSTDH